MARLAASRGVGQRAAEALRRQPVVVQFGIPLAILALLVAVAIAIGVGVATS